MTDQGFPRAFGPFTLLSTLGQGGMGSVYLAQKGDGEFRSLCVIKTLRHDFQEPDAPRRFRDESRIAVALNHPNICDVVGVGDVRGQSFLAMKYLGRTTLRHLYSRAREIQCPIPVELATWIASEVLNGLHYAHTLKDIQGTALNIVHRDVSPQNVMLTLNGEVKLIDFGLADSATKVEQTETGMVQGKIHYMAPEQVKAQPADARADHFATAILLYELVVGDRFYKGTDGVHQIWQVSGGGYRPKNWSVLEDLYPDLCASLDIGLQADPKERWPDCETMQRSLLAAVFKQKPAVRPNAQMLRQYMKVLWPNLDDEERSFLAGLPSNTFEPQPPSGAEDATREKPSSDRADRTLEALISDATTSDATTSDATTADVGMQGEETGALIEVLQQSQRPSMTFAIVILFVLGSLGFGFYTWGSTNESVSEVVPGHVTPNKQQAQQAKEHIREPTTEATRVVSSEQRHEVTRADAQPDSPLPSPLPKTATPTVKAESRLHANAPERVKATETGANDANDTAPGQRSATALSNDVQKLRNALEKCDAACAKAWLPRLIGEPSVAVMTVAKKCLKECTQ